jgi:hypothetical protein
MTLSASILLPSTPARAAKITIVNTDGALEGLNDPTVVSAVAGNSGTTLGAQRLNVLEAVANYWGSKISSSVEIRVSTAFDPLPCSSNAAVLGSAGPADVCHSDPTLPLQSTWYPIALANRYAGSDLSLLDDIGATINVRVDETLGTCSGTGDPCTTDMECPMAETCGCLVGVSWWYGIGAAAPVGTVSLYNTMWHEIAHGLGFLTLVDLPLGTEFQGMPDIFETHLEDHASGKLWPQMTDAERMASAIAQGDDELHWVGDAVGTDCGVIDVGANGAGHVKMYSPNPLELSSSVSHFDTSLFANELMEPRATANFEDRLTNALFEDIGWGPVALAVRAAGDVDINGFDDLAVLAADFDTGSNIVHVIDGSTGNLIGQIAFSSDWVPITMEIIDHFAGTTSNEVVVLLKNPVSGMVKAVVKDLSSGAPLSTVYFDIYFEAVDMEIVDNYGQTAAQEIAVLGKRRGVGQFVRVSVRDASNGVLLNDVFFKDFLAPIDLEVIVNFDGSPNNKLAVLGRACASANVHVAIRDVTGGPPLSRILFGKEYTMLDLEVISNISDPSGTNADEIVVLGRRYTDRAVKVWVKDAQNSFKISVLTFANDGEPIDIEVVPDFGGGTTVDEIGLLLRNEVTGRTIVQMRDASSGATAGNLFYWTDRIPRDLTVLPDASGNNVAEIGLIAVRQSDNQRRAHIRDATNAGTVFIDLP